jgi:MurNAc alpha-1-phosphate uridylyltransferase
MVFAAGRGERLRPITDVIPKPLIPLGDGDCSLGRILDLLTRFDQVVVNGCHLSDQVERFIHQNYPRCFFQKEDSVYETGGGLRLALHHFEPEDPLLIINGDIVFEGSFLNYLWSDWDANKMDALLGLVKRRKNDRGYGDYDYGKNNRIEFRPYPKTPYIYTGIAVVSIPAFSLIKNRSFSVKQFFDLCESKKRLYGVTLDLDWCDIGSFKELESVRNTLFYGE